MSVSQFWQEYKAFFKPHNWPVVLGLGMLRLLILLPTPFLFRLGEIAGRLMYMFARRRRRIAQINITLCFPDLSKQQQRQLVKDTFKSVGVALIETPLSWWASNERLRPLCHIQGLEHIQRLKLQGRPVILLGMHFTCLEIGGRLMALHQKTVNIYKKHANEVFEKIMSDSRRKHLDDLVQNRDMRSYIRKLKQGKVCWYAPDQDMGRKNSVFAPFMGINTATVTGTARMAKLCNAAVIPFAPSRRRDNSGYDLTILPPLEDFPSGDDIQDATRVNKVVAEAVMNNPTQYLWLHRRFKTRPEGETGFYKNI